MRTIIEPGDVFDHPDGELVVWLVFEVDHKDWARTYSTARGHETWLLDNLTKRLKVKGRPNV